MTGTACPVTITKHGSLEWVSVLSGMTREHLVLDYRVRVVEPRIQSVFYQCIERRCCVSWDEIVQLGSPVDGQQLLPYIRDRRKPNAIILHFVSAQMLIQ